MYLEIFLADFTVFHGKTWISQLRDCAKYQKPCFDNVYAGLNQSQQLKAMAAHQRSFLLFKGILGFSVMEQSLTIGWGGGRGGEEGRWYYFKSEGPKILALLRLTAPKFFPLQKCVPKTLP